MPQTSGERLLSKDAAPHNQDAVQLRSRLLDKATFSDRVQATFDARTTYDKEAHRWHSPLAEELVRRAALNEGNSVLDIATGSGVVAELAARVVGPSGSVLGIDISPGMLAQAQPKAAAYSGTLAFQLGNGETADFPPASFDAVLCSNGLLYMADVAKALKRWARWLRPGGVLCFNTPPTPFYRSTHLFLQAAEEQGLMLEDVAAVVGSEASARSVLHGAGFRDGDIQVEITTGAQFGNHSFASPEDYEAGVWAIKLRFYPLEKVLSPEAQHAMRERWRQGAIALARQIQEEDGRVIDMPNYVWVRAVKQ